jgi:3-deoxy-D-manno-octulosonic-acid transferase
LRHFDRIFAASHLDAERLKTLGARPERITCTGSIKFDVAVPAAAEAEEKAAMRKNLGFAETASGTAPFVLLGASTWPGEEAALLRAQAAARAAGVDCRLLIVPRHAERATEIIALLREQHLTWHQRSSKAPAPADVSIYLADTTGELAQLTALADLAFIGKSLPPNAGGQTPIEAAGLGIAMLMGPGMDNFKELAQRLNARGAAITVADADELRDTVIQLAQSPGKRSAMRMAAREWHKANRGSSERIADAILDCLQSG